MNELKENNQNTVGDKGVSNFLKDLAKVRKEQVQYKGVNDAILAKKSPKEKAQELYHKYFSMIKIESPIDRVSSIPYVKKCALIAVDEILDMVKHTPIEFIETDWWQEVKQEIENL